MIAYTPLAEFPAPTIAMEDGWRRRNDLAWVPLRDSEVRLSAHFYPLCVEMHEGQARLGALIGDAGRSAPLVDKDGQWLGAYQPMALRCFPFRLNASAKQSAGVLEALEVAVPSPTAAVSGQPGLMTIRNATSEPAKDLVNVYNECRISQASNDRLAGLLEPLVVADTLVALPSGDDIGRLRSWLTVHPGRLSALSGLALAATARCSLEPIEVAVAIAYSQKNLIQKYRISGDHRPPTAHAPAVAVPFWELSDYALDDSDLYSSSWLVDGMADPAHVPDRPLDPGAETLKGP